MIKFCNYLGGKIIKTDTSTPFPQKYNANQTAKKKLTNKTNRRKNSNKQHTDIEI